VGFDAGDVIIVPFPFTDRATTKRRPAVVISASAFNAATGHVIAAMITSARGSAWESDIPLTDLAAAGLPSPCVIRLKLFTLDAGLIIRKAGRLGSGDAKALRSGLTAAIPQN
jgi:mRNA interferase MazF